MDIESVQRVNKDVDFDSSLEVDDTYPPLTKLVEKLEHNIRVKSTFINNFTDPSLLVEGLKELNNTIGNMSFKADVTKQVEHIIANSIRKLESSEKPSDEPEYNNIVIYGPPGTGKSMLSVVIAKVFYALGLLRRQKPVQRQQEEEKNTSDQKGKSDQKGFVAFIIENVLLLVMLGVILKFIYSYVPEQHKMYAVVFLVFVFLVLSYIFYSTYVLLDKRSPIEINLNDRSKKKSKIDTSTNFVTKANRNTFAAPYMGQTSDKTMKFLEENLGNVVFVDEAYSLIHGSTDQYGQELGAALVQFMSEKPNDIIFIFAGYEDKLNQTVFRFQPGFVRRFAYHWTCAGYTPQELYRIFRYKLKASGWSVNEAEESEIRKLIIDNYENFTSFGGDIENVIKFAKYEHSQSIIHSKVPGLTKLGVVHVKAGIETFMSNKKRTDVSRKEENLLDKLIKNGVLDS